MQRLYRWKTRTIPINDDNAMHMIRHHHEFMKVNKWEMVRYAMPTIMGNLSNLRKTHLPLLHLSEEMLTVVGADGDEIGSIAPIIPPWGAGRRDAVFVAK